MNITIRRGSRGDLEQLMTLWLSGSRQGNPFIQEEYWEARYNLVRDLMWDLTVFVAVDDTQQILGFIAMEDRVLFGCYVAEIYRSMGIGKALLDRCKQDHTYLKLQVYAKNKRAVRFCQREGFLMTKAQVDSETGAMEYYMAWTTMYDTIKA
jgi:putative acetyltransferase